MKHVLCTAFVLAALAAFGPASAGDAQTAAAAVTVKGAWLRLLPGDLPAGGYATLANSSDRTLRLTGAKSAAFGMLMLHRSTHADGMSGMHMVAGMDIPAHASAALAPGGYHLMALHRSRALKVGDSVTVTLVFADGSHLDVPFKLRPANAH